MDAESAYQDIFTSRYCRDSPLSALFSERHRVETWRQLWIWLAEGERALGLDGRISEEAVDCR